MTTERFKVSRRYVGTPFTLAREHNSVDLFRGWYQLLTPWVKAIGYGLFALTDERNPMAWQEVSAGQLLEVLEVARHPTGSDTLVFHGQHYRDAFTALERLFNVAVPIRTRTIRKVGQRWKKEDRVGYVRLLQGFQLIYRDPSGQTIDLSDPRFADYRVNINRRYEQKADAKRRRGGKATATTDAQAVFALAKFDGAGRPIIGDDGQPEIQRPSAYAFRWATDIIEDLTESRGGGKGCGYLHVCRTIFTVLRDLRRHNKQTAARLLDLVVSDIMPRANNRTVLEKNAKFIFAALGLPEPGNLKRGHEHERDGRWSQNVAQVADAVRDLKAAGVLLPESDEAPRVDPNRDRRRTPYYRWRRSPAWIFTTAIEILDDSELAPVAGTPRTTAVGMADKLSPDLFGNVEPPSPTGRDIRAAREAAGLTLRAFARRFGGSIWQWSMIEREECHRRTREPIPVPLLVRDQVAAFVFQHLGQKDSTTG